MPQISQIGGVGGRLDSSSVWVGWWGCVEVKVWSRASLGMEGEARKGEWKGSTPARDCPDYSMFLVSIWRCTCPWPKCKDKEGQEPWERKLNSTESHGCTCVLWNKITGEKKLNKKKFWGCPKLSTPVFIFQTNHQSVTRPIYRVTPEGNRKEYTEFRFVEYWLSFSVNHGCLCLWSEVLEQWVRQRSDCIAWGGKRVELLYFVNQSAQIEMPTLAEN